MKVSHRYWQPSVRSGYQTLVLDNWFAWKYKGYLRLQAKDYDKAIEALSQALRIEEKYVLTVSFAAPSQRWHFFLDGVLLGPSSATHSSSKSDTTKPCRAMPRHSSTRQVMWLRCITRARHTSTRKTLTRPVLVSTRSSSSLKTSRTRTTTRARCSLPNRRSQWPFNASTRPSSVARTKSLCTTRKVRVIDWAVLLTLLCCLLNPFSIVGRVSNTGNMHTEIWLQKVVIFISTY